MVYMTIRSRHGQSVLLDCLSLLMLGLSFRSTKLLSFAMRSAARSVTLALALSFHESDVQDKEYA